MAARHRAASRAKVKAQRTAGPPSYSAFSQRCLDLARDRSSHRWRLLFPDRRNRACPRRAIYRRLLIVEPQRQGTQGRRQRPIHDVEPQCQGTQHGTSGGSIRSTDPPPMRADEFDRQSSARRPAAARSVVSSVNTSPAVDTLHPRSDSSPLDGIGQPPALAAAAPAAANTPLAAATITSTFPTVQQILCNLSQGIIDNTGPALLSILGPRQQFSLQDVITAIVTNEWDGRQILGNGADGTADQPGWARSVAG